MIPPRPIRFDYPNRCQHDPRKWVVVLEQCGEMLDELKSRTEPPTDEAFQAVAHLFVTLVHDHLRRVH